MSESFILTLSCIDHPGIVARVAGTLARLGANIRAAEQFEDSQAGAFFMRVQFGLLDERNLPKVEEAIAEAGADHGMEWKIRRASERKRVILLASKFDHCLTDLLYRSRTNDLMIDIVAIVSNHPREVYAHLDLGDIPFHHLPVTKETKAEQEGKLRAIIDATNADLVVLARYMQVLSDDLTSHLAGRCINIHHSFLPGFKGAKPYHQAHARGVKLIGATAHFVTADLDEGPIIEQDVERVTHRDTPEDLVRKGRDIERRVLARAVRAYVEDKVLINGKTTVVFHS